MTVYEEEMDNGSITALHMNVETSEVGGTNLDLRPGDNCVLNVNQYVKDQYIQ